MLLLASEEPQSGQVRATQSGYMNWAKFKPAVRYQLTGSEVPHFRMDSLGISVGDLDLDGASHPRYQPLRKAIAARYEVPSDRVVAADGASMANFLAMAALVAPGDEVIIEFPAYEPLLAAASFLGARIVRFERRAEERFRIDPERVASVLTERTRLCVLTNLHNPTGALCEEEELKEVGSLAARAGAHVLVDEVYLDSAVPPRRSAVHLGDQFVCTSSLTKVYGLSGLRCGWILCNEELAERMWRLNDLMGVNQAHPAERLACIAFREIDTVVGDNRILLERNREQWNDFCSLRGDLDCMPATHGITAFPRWTGGDSERLDRHLREHHDCAVVPGHWFEMADHFRVGFGLGPEDFDEALRRLGKALDELQ